LICMLPRTSLEALPHTPSNGTLVGTVRFHIGDRDTYRKSVFRQLHKQVFGSQQARGYGGPEPRLRHTPRRASQHPHQHPETGCGRVPCRRGWLFYHWGDCLLDHERPQKTMESSSPNSWARPRTPHRACATHVAWHPPLSSIPHRDQGPNTPASTSREMRPHKRRRPMGRTGRGSLSRHASSHL
jgi:hypothetical protein